MADKIKAETKFSNFQYSGFFSEPVFEPIVLYSTIGAVYEGLKPLNISPGDVKYLGVGLTSPNDHLVSFELAKNHYTLSLALAGFTLKANFVDWSQAPVISEIIKTTSNVLHKAANRTVNRHEFHIMMQVVVDSVSTKELTRALSISVSRPANDVEFHGIILHTSTGMFVVDKSTVNENGLFLHILRKFSGELDIDRMAKVLHDEEAWLSATLGIEIE